MPAINHVGLCVADRGRSRAFYEGLLGFDFWWELDVPDQAAAQLLSCPEPVGMHATFLIRGWFVLELLEYAKHPIEECDRRGLDHRGLTHLSVSVPDLDEIVRRVGEFGGSLVEGSVTARSAMIRDPDGQVLEILPDAWLQNLPPMPHPVDPAP